MRSSCVSFRAPVWAALWTRAARYVDVEWF
jgi:hypothetical protein